MNSDLPRIAIPEPTSSDAAYNQRSLPQYISAVEEAGGVAVPISLLASQASQAGELASCSAVLLPGSPADVDPLRYGQQATRECAARDQAREATDDFLLRDAFEHGKPILGICYGLQFLNVWRRGTLVLHLPTLTTVNHEPGRGVQNAHPIAVAPASRLSRILGHGINLPQVNSSHHQAIDRPGENLRVGATSPADGVIEALEGADPEHFVVAVQWHPERTYQENPESRALFAALVGAAREWNHQKA